MEEGEKEEEMKKEGGAKSKTSTEKTETEKENNNEEEDSNKRVGGGRKRRSETAPVAKDGKRKGVSETDCESERKKRRSRRRSKIYPWFLREGLTDPATTKGVYDMEAKTTWEEWKKKGKWHDTIATVTGELLWDKKQMGGTKLGDVSTAMARWKERVVKHELFVEHMRQAQSNPAVHDKCASIYFHIIYRWINENCLDENDNVEERKWEFTEKFPLDNKIYIPSIHYYTEIPRSEKLEEMLKHQRKRGTKLRLKKVKGRQDTVWYDALMAEYEYRCGKYDEDNNWRPGKKNMYYRPVSPDSGLPIEESSMTDGDVIETKQKSNVAEQTNKEGGVDIAEKGKEDEKSGNVRVHIVYSCYIK